MNPIPAKVAKRAVGGDARRERLVVEVEEKVVLCFTETRELLTEDTIAEEAGFVRVRVLGLRWRGFA